MAVTDTVETGQSACNVKGRKNGKEERVRTIIIDQCHLIVAHEPV
jgi:hypothetical protein